MAALLLIRKKWAVVLGAVSLYFAFLFSALAPILGIRAQVEIARRQGMSGDQIDGLLLKLALDRPMIFTAIAFATGLLLFALVGTLRNPARVTARETVK